MDRCNELCTKAATGSCAVCEALAERDQFIRFWFKGGLLVDGVRALKRGEVLACLRQYVCLIVRLALHQQWRQFNKKPEAKVDLSNRRVISCVFHGKAATDSR